LNSSLYFFSLFFSFTSGSLSTSILVSVKTGELQYLRFQIVEGLFANPVLPTDLADLYAGLGLFQNVDDFLIFGRVSRRRTAISKASTPG
jgi:hypothetical protein